MPMIRRLLIAGLLAGFPAFAAPSPAAAADGDRSGVFFPETTVLDNGLQVVVVENPTAPVVTQMLWYRVGAADEPPGKSGVAHYLEHLMFLGTEDRPDGFGDVVRRNGGRENAFTSWDFTGYFQSVAADRLGLMMALEADRMANLALEPGEALNERSVIIEERRQRIDNNPSARLSEQMRAALYQNHPYRIPIIGWEHEMAALTVEDAVAFYEDWYAPNNAVLVVSGDVEAERVFALAAETYGRVPARTVPVRVRPTEPDQQAPRRIRVQDERVQLPSWRRFYLAPSYRSEGAEHAYALQVLSAIFGSGGTSRLYRSLVVEQELAVAAGMAYSPSDLDETAMVAYANPRPGVDLATLEAAFDAEIAHLLADGVTEEEVARAQERLVIYAILARDSLDGPVRTIGQQLAIGRTVEDVEAWPERIRAVTADQVDAAARAVLRADRSVTGVLEPAPRQTAQQVQ